MSISYDKDGFCLSITAGVADEPKGKRRWTWVEASYLGHPCSDFESLATLRAWLGCFLRKHVTGGEPRLGLGSELDGVSFAVRQKDKVQYLYACRTSKGSVVFEQHLDAMEVARLEIAVSKALQALSPSSIWGPEPEQK